MYTPQGRRKIGNVLALCGGILATLAFFLFPYISLGIFGSYTAVQLANGVFGSSAAPSFWLELVVALVIVALAAVAWHRPGPSAVLPSVIIGVSSLTLLVLGATYVMQSQQQSLFGSAASFYSTGFWLYLFGIVVALVGGIFQVRGFSR